MVIATVINICLPICSVKNLCTICFLLFFLKIHIPKNRQSCQIHWYDQLLVYRHSGASQYVQSLFAFVPVWISSSKVDRPGLMLISADWGVRSNSILVGSKYRSNKTRPWSSRTMKVAPSVAPAPIQAFCLNPNRSFTACISAGIATRVFEGA